MGALELAAVCHWTVIQTRLKRWTKVIRPYNATRHRTNWRVVSSISAVGK